MRALPLPRKSRSRRLRKLLHQIYYILSMKWIFKRRQQIIIKKRRTPFHFSARKYKVKIPRQDRQSSKCDRILHPFRRKVVTTQILNNINNEQDIKSVNLLFHKHRFRHRFPFLCTKAMVSQIVK